MADTRRRILEVAFEVFCRYGYQKVEMTDIAQGAGLSRQGLYRHFPTKEDLFGAVVADVHEITHRLAEDAGRAAASGGAVAVLTATLGARLVWYVEHIYATVHGLELLGEGSRRCRDLNTAASARFLRLVETTIRAETRDGRLVLPRGLPAARLADLLIRATNALKTGEPAVIATTRIASRHAQMVALLCASLVPAGARTRSQGGRDG